MFKNYFTIALRTLWKNKLFTVINILGLAIGISASLIIFLLINYHFSFDTFEKDRNRIYRVVSNFSFSGEIYRNSGVTVPLTDAIKNEVTGLDAVVPLYRWDSDTKVTVENPTSKAGDIFKKQSDIVFADSRYFDLVNYEWLAGSPKSALLEPYQTVLTKSNAQLYFPSLTPTQEYALDISSHDTSWTGK